MSVIRYSIFVLATLSLTISLPAVSETNEDRNVEKNADREAAIGMQDYLQHIRQLTNQGRYREALDGHIWFHQNALKHEPSMYGVRLSFALSDWKRLGEVYPPAAESLFEIRDKKVELLRRGKGDFELFHDVEAILALYNERDKIVPIFRELDQSDEGWAKDAWRVIDDLMIERLEIDLISKYIKDPLDIFSRKIESYNRFNAFEEQRKDSRVPRSAAKFFIRDVTSLIRACVATDRLEVAETILTRANEILDDPRLQAIKINVLAKEIQDELKRKEELQDKNTDADNEKS